MTFYSRSSLTCKQSLCTLSPGVVSCKLAILLLYLLLLCLFCVLLLLVFLLLFLLSLLHVVR